MAPDEEATTLEEEDTGSESEELRAALVAAAELDGVVTDVVDEASLLDDSGPEDGGSLEEVPNADELSAALLDDDNGAEELSCALVVVAVALEESPGWEELTWALLEAPGEELSGPEEPPEPDESSGPEVLPVPEELTPAVELATTPLEAPDDAVWPPPSAPSSGSVPGVPGPTQDPHPASDTTAAHATPRAYLVVMSPPRHGRHPGGQPRG